MQIEFASIFYIAIALIYVCSIGYLICSVLVVEFFGRKRDLIDKPKFHPAVTILKPIYGLDPEMEDNLRSFCQQDYPHYQIIFGLQDKNDPAIPIVKKIVAEFKNRDVGYVIDTRIHGNNHKVSNLINMAPTVKHDYLLIADSDMRVPTDYLSNVMSPFFDKEIGAVTCLYSGSARSKSIQGKLASALNTMFINEWFFPSVLISKMIVPIKYCLGATMIVRCEILDNMGGFKALSNHLADDYMLGKHVTEQGYKIYLSDFVVENIVEETSIKDLIIHELRWARTLRRVEPIGYAFTLLTDTFVIGFITSFTLYIATSHVLWSISPVLFVLAMRIILHKRVKHIVGAKRAGAFWLIPLRDILSFLIRIISFTGNSVKWRNNLFNVDGAGLIYNSQKSKIKLDAAADIPDLATTQDY